MVEFKNDPKAKRYFWLKLKTDFFDQKEIKLLRRIAGGDTYTIIYLKMLLTSLRHEGVLYYEAIGDNFEEEIALDIDESPEDVALTIKFLESKGLIELVERDEYFLNRVPEMIGSESYSAERVRRHRHKKVLQSDGISLQSNKLVTASNEEIDIEIDKDIEPKLNRHKYGEFKNVLLSDSEIDNLKSKFPKDWEKRIDNLSMYIGSTGKKYKSHYMTILSWARKDSSNQPINENNLKDLGSKPWYDE